MCVNFRPETLPILRIFLDASFTKLTYIIDVSFGNFSYEKHAILFHKIIVFTLYAKSE
jgi:hypothetical protein